MADQFQTGDVFLFEPDDSCISRLICKLSDSPVSHAAMYFEDGKIVEEGLPHIGTRPIDKLGDRAVHVRRYARHEESAAALRKVAGKRLADKEPYSMGNLVMVGVLIVFKAWKPDARWAVKQVLTALCILIAKAIDHYKTGGKHGATCSQLVYEMYDEAGFHLNVIQKNMVSAANAPSLLEETQALLAEGKLDEVDESAASELDKAAAMGGKNFDLEKLCCALLAVMDGNDRANVMESAEESEQDEVYEEVVRFASMVLQADSADTVFTRDTGILDWGKRALAHLMNNYAGFITPGQLYSDCPDLAHEIIVLKP